MAAFEGPPPPPPPAHQAAPAAGPVLRPLGIGEILDRAIKVYLSHFGTLARIVLVVVVPVQIVSLAISYVTTPPTLLDVQSPFTRLEPGQLPIRGDDLPVYVGGAVVNTILGIAVFVLTTAACFRAIADAYLGGRPDWRESLRFAAGKAASLLWLYILTGAILLVALLPCLIPAFYLWIAWLVATPALLLEDARGFQAMSRSFALVRGRWWATFGCMLVAVILVAVVGGFVGVVVGVVTFVAHDSPLAVLAVNALSSMVSSVISTPFVAAVVTLIYFDLRVRKEGLDLQLLAQRIGAPAPTPGAPAFSAPPPGLAAPPPPPPPPPSPPPSPPPAQPDPFGR